jgi:YbbR domain-containing protein
MPADKSQEKGIGLKFISVIMAVLLWFYIVNQDTLATGRNMQEVNLQYRNVPQNYTVNGPEKVSVKVWGSYGDTGSIIAYADLAGLGKGRHTVPVNVSPVKGAMFTSVRPDKVEIQLEDLRQHIIPVGYEISKHPPTGYILDQVVSSPATCVIKGQQEVVDKVVSVAASLDLSNARDVTCFKTVLRAKDARGSVISQGITLVPQTVEIYAVVQKRQDVKKVPVKPQISGSPAEGFLVGDIKVDPAEVTVLGDQTKVDAVKEISTGTVDIKDAKENLTREAELNKTEGIIIRPEHVSVTVTVEKVVQPEVKP